MGMNKNKLKEQFILKGKVLGMRMENKETNFHKYIADKWIDVEVFDNYPSKEEILSAVEDFEEEIDSVQVTLIRKVVKEEKVSDRGFHTMVDREGKVTTIDNRHDEEISKEMLEKYKKEGFSKEQLIEFQKEYLRKFDPDVTEEELDFLVGVTNKEYKEERLPKLIEVTLEETYWDKKDVTPIEEQGEFIKLTEESEDGIDTITLSPNCATLLEAVKKNTKMPFWLTIKMFEKENDIGLTRDQLELLQVKMKEVLDAYDNLVDNNTKEE